MTNGLDINTVIQIICAATMALLGWLGKRTADKVDTACKAIAELVTTTRLTDRDVAEVKADHSHFHRSLEDHRRRIEDHEGRVKILEHETRCSGFKMREPDMRAD